MTVRSSPDPDINVIQREKSGCFGVVWHGRQQSLARDVAIKIMDPYMAAARDVLEHARGVALAGGHQHVVTVHGVTSISHPETGELVDAVIMEWLNGDSLATKLSGPPFAEEWALNVCRALCDALDHIHSKGIPHGDLHPGNVMFSGDVVKVIDIDYSNPKSSGLITTASKEQLIGKDVASLGFITSAVLQRSTISATTVQPFDQRLRAALSTDDIRGLIGQIADRSTTDTVQAAEIRVSEALPTDGVLQSIQAARPNRRALVRQFMRSVVEQLKVIAPVYSNGAEWDDAFTAAVERALPMTVACARVSSEIGAMGDLEAAEAMYKGFGDFLANYQFQGGGSFYETDFDFYKFLAHEILVGLFSALLREDHFELISNLLLTGIYSSRGNSSGELFDFTAVSEYIKTFAIRNQRLNLGRVSLHADLLHMRYSESELSSYISVHDFIDADYLLLLRDDDWRPWSALYLRRMPRFLELVSKPS